MCTSSLNHTCLFVDCRRHEECLVLCALSFIVLIVDEANDFMNIIGS